jgi:hypothetical protein
MNERGFIMFNRADETMELLRDPHAFTLLALIAQRARWRTLPDGLDLGEAMLGDCERFGMTRAIYRRALKKLIKWNQITIRKTNRGTIAKLISSLVFDINLTGNVHPESHQERQQNANGKPLENHQKTNGEPLTNKGRTKEGDKEIKKNAVAEREDAALDIAATITDLNELKERLRELYPEHDIHAEWKSYGKYRDRLDKAKTAVTFVAWLEKAQPRIQDNNGPRDVSNEVPPDWD